VRFVFAGGQAGDVCVGSPLARFAMGFPGASKARHRSVTRHRDGGPRVGPQRHACGPPERGTLASPAVVALAAIGPKDELEGMIAAQLLAAHNATMECYRRAMLPEQTSEGRSENLNQANKLSRTYVVLLDALNRQRGKGQQKVTGSTSTCIPAAKLSSAWSGPRGEGVARNLRINPMQSKSPMHLSRRCGARTRRGSRCQSPAMPNGRCRLHGGKSPGAPKGNINAFKHGRYSAETIEARRKIAATAGIHMGVTVRP
jgi:hypothetical protein